MKILNSVVKGYVDIIRGTPIILQLMIIIKVFMSVLNLVLIL